MSRNRLYTILIVLCIVGYTWLFYHLSQEEQDSNMELCIFKFATGIPCPSCGTTRASISIFRGDISEVFQQNILGFIIAPTLLILPFWLFWDFISKKSTLLSAYLYIENVIRKPPIAVLLVILVLINWVWNITKGL